MCHSQVEIEHYSVTIEIELMLPVEGYNHPGYCVQVCVARSLAKLRYKPEARARTRSTNYARDASM